MESTITLSIIVPVYNHEDYIMEALESILMQKVNFKYEVFIGEDHSKDNSKKILQSFEEKAPNNFYFLYRTKNLGMQENFNDMVIRSKGKYLCVLEGDDYWTYEYKLQKQVDFLETHPEYLAVAHNTLCVDKDSKPIENYHYPECKDKNYTLKHYRKGLLPGQTATLLYHNYYKRRMFSTKIEYVSFPGDRRNAYILTANGKVFCIQETWAAYRHVTDSGTSFSATLKIDDDYKKRELQFFKSLYIYSKYEVKSKESIIVSMQLYFSSYLLNCIKRNQHFSFYEFIKEFLYAPYKHRFFFFFIYKISMLLSKKIKMFLKLNKL